MTELSLGGADTTVSSEYAFFLAMVLNPGKPSVLQQLAFTEEH
jgi:hypothetical protein